MHRNGLDSTKKSYKNDILLILFFLIIGIGAFAFMQLQGKSGAEVKVSVNNKDCPDKICVNHAAISKKGETIVCLPHKVVVEVVDENGTQDGNQIDIISK